MNKNIYRDLYKLIMACSSTRDSETTSTASGSHPRRLFPLETVIIWINMTVLQMYGYLQRESSSRDSSPVDNEESPDVDNEGSPDVDEVFRLRCDCKSTCQRRGCPCKAAAKTCGVLCKCGTRKNPCKNQVSQLFSCNC